MRKRYLETGHNEDQDLLTKRISEVINWRISPSSKKTDIAEWREDHLSFKGSVSQKDLDTMCDTVNSVFKKINSKARIINGMGEIRPASRVHLD